MMHSHLFTHTALLQEPVGDPAKGRVRCLTCERRCLLADGQVGPSQSGQHTTEEHTQVTQLENIDAHRISRFGMLAD